MINNNIYCKVSGMVMQCIIDSQRQTSKLPIVIEVGCADGLGTARYAGFCKHVIAIDAMASGRPDLQPDEAFVVDEEKIKRFERNVSGLARMNDDGSHGTQTISLMIGLSTDPRVVEQVSELLDGEMADVLIIDGAHHPSEAVIADFEAYIGFVRPGGFVVFDDTYEPDVMSAVDVARDKHGLVEHDRFELREKQILQACIALRKSE